MTTQEAAPTGQNNRASGPSIDSLQVSQGGTANIAGRDIINNYTLSLDAQAAVKMILEQSSKSADVRAELALWQDNLADVQRQIKLLGDFKDMHDLLHRLQYDCYGPMQQELGKFPGDLTSQMNLEKYNVQMEGLIEEAGLLIQSKTFAGGENDWIELLQDAHQSLTNATLNGDAGELNTSSSLLAHILSVQPTALNKMLNQAARELDLLQLVAVLEKVGGRLDQAEAQARVQNGIQSIQKLNERLQGMIADHDRWQALENDLRAYEANLESLPRMWKYPRKKLVEICAGRTETWAVIILKLVQGLDQLLTGQDAQTVEAYFLNLKGQVGIRFFTVDNELKRLCGNLRDIENPLNDVRSAA